ncbi:MAG: Maf family protein, partial [Pseudolabrys sp.]
MPLWLPRQPLVLASKSDIRGKILAAAGLRFEIRPAQIDERAVETQAGVSDPVAAARVLARAKAESVAATVAGRAVLGADQTLARGTLRLSKPADRAAAAEQLRALRGRTHELHSALALVRDGELLFSCVETARLTMRDFSDRFLDEYLDMAGAAALSSVGAYQLEG